MILTSFKTEVEAIATPPKLFFTPTLENYITVRERADYVHFALNSVIISVGATLLATLIAVPAAYAMAFFPGKRTKDLLLWMLSTKMMPAVGVLIPIYLLFRDTGRDRHALGPDRRLHADEPADRGLDALHLLQGGAEGHPRGGPHGRRQAQAGGLDAAAAAVAARHRIDGPPVDHPVLERGVLEPQPHHLAGGAADRPSSPRSLRPRACSGPSSRPPRRSRSRRSSSSAG